MSVTPVDASRERVQVAIRFRDPNDNEDSASCIDFDLPHDLTVHTIPGSGLCSSASSYNAMSASRRMTFDRVFPPTTTQEELFESIGVPTVRSVLKGLNGTILAYGQTGSGKSHSMIGPNGGAPEALVHGTREYEQQGLIPRMLTFMFDTLRTHSIYREFALHDTVLGSTATTTTSSSSTTTPRLTEEEMERGAVLGRWGVPCNGHRSASGTGRQSRTNVTGVANRSTSQRKNHPTGQHVNETPHENELKASQSASSATVETDMPLGDVEGSPSSPLGFRANRKTATLSAEISYSICMSVFELYMEQIIDLLDTDPPSGHPYLSPAKEYRIRESPLNGKGIFVENLTELRCTSHTEALNAIRDALSFRKASTTNLNERSSRSHCFVVLDVTQVDHTRHDARIMSRLCLVDLAGSEKVSKTGAEGVRLKEAQTINLSLTLLGNVIHKLTDKRALFVPYRDSKLTRLLQESFGGNSRTTLLCTCSESVTNRDETLSTLAFASRAKLIENKPRVNQKLKGKDLEVAYLHMMAECSRLNDRVRFLERSKNDHSANTTPRSTYRSFTGLGAEDTGENSARDTRQSALGNQSSARAHSAVPPIQLPSELFRTPRHTPIGSIHDEFSDVTPRGECYNSDHERLIQSLHATIDQLRAENIEKDALLMELNSRMEYYGNRFQALHESVGSVEQQLRQDQTIAMHWDRKLEEISHHLLKHEESRKKQSVDRFYPCANSNTTIESDNAERYSLRPSTSEYEISAIPTDVQTTKASTTNSCEDEHLELLRPEPQAYSKQRTAHSKVTLYANAETLRI